MYYRQQTGQSQYYLPVSGLTYSQQVYGQKSSSYPNVQTNQAVGAHRNSLGNLNNHNVVNHASNATPTLVHLPKSDIPPSNHYQFPQVASNGGQQQQYTAIQVRYTPQRPTTTAVADEKKLSSKQIMKNTDIESSLESLCLQMTEHALGP